MSCSINGTTCIQSHYIEVEQGDIFMEQKRWFELFLSWLAILKKKIWADYEQLLRVVFHVFMEKIFLERCSVPTKKLHNISFIIFFLNLKYFFLLKIPYILFWKWKFSNSFRIMAIFYIINWIVASETIEGRKLFAEVR